VANIHIRFKLLFGNWDYETSGILDRTHLRFFTKKTVKKLFKSTEYKIIKIDSTPGFNFLVLRHFEILKKIKNKLCSLYPKLFATQFIVIAKSN